MRRILPLLAALLLAPAAPGSASGQAGGTFGNQYAVYEILGGVDYPLIGPLDFRVVEIGGGSGIANFGSYKPAFFTVNTGLVVHFSGIS